MIKLFSDIKLTKGYNRSLMQDFTKGKIEFVYNDIYNLLSTCNTLEELNNVIKSKPHLKNNIHMLSNLFVFNQSKSDVHNFPEIEMTRFLPYAFQAITILFNEENAIHMIQNKNLYAKSTQNIYLLLNNSNSHLKELLNQYMDLQNIRFVLVCMSKEVYDLLLLNEFQNDGNIEIVLYDDSLPSFELSNNFYTFSENQKYNSGWNEKLHINSEGNIGINVDDGLCFANIVQITNFEDLASLIEHSDYIKYATSLNDNTLVCQDCEFRFMCTDIQKPYQVLGHSLYYKKTECSYNPYIAKWEEEEGYHTLSECGVISNENGLSVDHKKVARINAVLWSEK